MMTERQPFAGAVGIALLAASLTACTSDEAPRDAVGPADAIVDLVLETGDEQAIQQHLRYEEALAACMGEAGFEYVPDPNGLFFIEFPAGEGLDSRAFAEQYGYGLRSQPAGAAAATAVGDNPNDAIVAAMTEAEAAEYESVRDGTSYEDYLSGSPEDQADWTRHGCDGRARHEVYDSGPVADQTYLALEAEIERIDAEVVPSHPDVVAADAAWVECMADAGFPGYTRQPEARQGEFDRLGASGGGAGPVRPDGTTDGLLAGAEEEVAIATADWDCTDQARYLDIVARVRNEAQQEYVDAHRDALDAWVERWTQDQQTEDEG
jgi:hypothetical protein